jgi:hypothetical protein
MKLGIVGSRRRNTSEDFNKVLNVVIVYIKVFGRENVILVSGGCKKGADSFVGTLVRDLNLPESIIHKPNVSENAYVGKKAYAIACFNRNSLIARDSDHLIAVVAEDRKGGTEDTIKKFKKFHPEGKLILL